MAMAVSTIRVAAARVSPGEWTRRRGRDRGARPTRRPLPAPPRTAASGNSHADAASPEDAFAPDPALAASIDAVTRACDLLLDLGSSCRAHAKPDDTPVTVADLACQVLVTQALRQSLGDDVVVIGEEDDAVCIADAATSEAVVEAVARHGGDGATAVEALARRVCVDDESLDALDMRRDAAESTRRRGGKSPVGSVPARPRYFVLDPIDGTKAFIRGVDDPASPQCAVGLARVDPANGAPDLGVLGLPFWRGPPLAPGDGVGVVVAASAGKGCWYKPLFSGEPGQSGWRRARVSNVSADASADWTVVTSEGERLENLPIGVALASETFGGGVPGSNPAADETQTPSEVRMGCGSLCKYAAVALDVAQVFVQHPPLDYALKGKRSMVWDHAAGIVCAAEAGATVTDLRGGAVRLGDGEREVRAFEPGGGGILVAAAGIHARCLELYTWGASAGKLGKS